MNCVWGLLHLGDRNEGVELNRSGFFHYTVFKILISSLSKISSFVEGNKAAPFMSLATRSSFSKPFNRRQFFSACWQTLKAMASVAFAVPLSMFRPSVSFGQMVAEFY